MCYLQIGCVHVQLLSQLKLEREIKDSNFSDFCNSFHSLAENWKERRPKEVLALGMTSEIYLLKRVLRGGVAMVTRELRNGGALPSQDL